MPTDSNNDHQFTAVYGSVLIHVPAKTATSDIRSLVIDGSKAATFCDPNRYAGVCNRGTCNEQGTACICDSHVVTFPKDSVDKCDYHQENTAGAFCMEFFLGVFGGGYWFLGYFALAGGQLALTVGSNLLWFVFGGTHDNVGTTGEPGIARYWRRISGTGIFAWWLYAIIMIGMGKYTDRNGAPMYSF
jgi:hypothetical protein